MRRDETTTGSAVLHQNLVHRRSPSTIWEEIDAAPPHDAERWIAAVAAGVCLAVGWRRRSTAGIVLSLAGAALGWWAAADREERYFRRTQIARRRSRDQIDEQVDEALLESFPASDAPAVGSAAGVRPTTPAGEASPPPAPRK